jgi:hypothetical protein
MNRFNFMPTNRRALLGGIAGSLLYASVAGATTATKQARSGSIVGLPQVPAYYRFKLGAAECTVVSDGPYGER